MKTELSFDGNGINGPDQYKTRIATFTSGVDSKKFGTLFAAAPELLSAAKEALEIVRHAKKFLRYQQPGNEFYPNRESADGTEARLQAAIAKAEGGKS